ncbi:stage III sporulation protein AF [Paenibacillus xerothermodurans]|uniref:Stage III sporulation protein AF n=1 Tax=Paenibacillus xerothermodurans TaxID=1977292 RepID=A0A2W1P4I8_PAEXE|nr:stage III sporulation protein AF [Paenibacillus xerothermodurans]PZE22058.1 stage III sporulation protein AF [Paenibacillus xerothermodurans]
MDWLAGWLKSIILVILLATFVDILLPNQTMQRYVKTVMSLFILLCLLQPLLSLFEKQASVDQLMTNVETLFERNSSSTAISAMATAQGAQPGLNTLAGIQEQAKRLKDQHAQQSERLMQRQISDLMKRDIEQSTAADVLSVEVQTGRDESGEVQIRHVQVEAAVKAQPEEADKAAPQPSAVEPVVVEQVKPIRIRIDPLPEPAAAGSGDAGEAGSGVPSDAAQEAAAESIAQQQTNIKMLLNKQWQVPLDSLSVVVTAGER